MKCALITHACIRTNADYLDICMKNETSFSHVTFLLAVSVFGTQKGNSSQRRYLDETIVRLY